MTNEDSILKPLDLDEKVVETPEVEVSDQASSDSSQPVVDPITDRTSFLTVGAHKPWDIEDTRFGKIATVGVVEEMKKA